MTASKNAIGEVESQVGVTRLVVQNDFLVRILVTHPITPWLVMHCSFLLNRFQIGHDGRSAYERLRKWKFEESWVQIPGMTKR